MSVTFKTTFEQLPPEAQNVFIQQQERMQKQENLYEEISQHSYRPIDDTRKRMKTEEEVHI